MGRGCLTQQPIRSTTNSTRPLLHHFFLGASEGCFSNATFKAFEETGEAFAVSTDISDRDFEVLKEEVFSVIPAEEQETPGLFPLILVPGVGTVIGIGVLTYATWKAANNLQEALEEGDILWIPVDEQLTDNENITTLDPPDVDFGTAPLDLGEPIGFDDNTFFPKGEGFLDDILEGRYEFPSSDEVGFTFFNATEIPERPIGKTTFLDIPFLKRKGVDAEGLKEGAVGNAGGRFDIYKDQEDNLWAVEKKQNPEESDLWLDNLKNYE